MAAIDKEMIKTFIMDADDTEQLEMLESFKAENMCHELERRLVDSRERIKAVQTLIDCEVN